MPPSRRDGERENGAVSGRARQGRAASYAVAGVVIFLCAFSVFRLDGLQQEGLRHQPQPPEPWEPAATTENLERQSSALEIDAVEEERRVREDEATQGKAQDGTRGHVGDRSSSSSSSSRIGSSSSSSRGDSTSKDTKRNKNDDRDASLLSKASWEQQNASAERESRRVDGTSSPNIAGKTTVHVSEVGTVPSEKSSIQPIHLPFHQKPDQWEMAGHGISLSAKGEPKSGNTWLGRLIPQLALELCGSRTNKWCTMGGLQVNPNEPAPWYEFEMVNKHGGKKGNRPSVFLHFKGDSKHRIPGMDWTNVDHVDCRKGGRLHHNFFEYDRPCYWDVPPSRKSLRNCLWSTLPPCLEFLPSRDKAVRRTVVIVRDPRNVIISERNMRLDYYNHVWIKEMSLDEYVQRRFEILVSWIHQRWVWHTDTIMNTTSLVLFYEDLQENHLSMIDLAAFMGLECDVEQAQRVWKSHQNASPHGDYNTHGLSEETISYMNATMAKLLPEPMVNRWSIIPTDL